MPIPATPNDIFQFSTFSALRAGFDTGQPRTTDLSTHGTDGIGIFEDGTLLVLSNSQAYTISHDGKAIHAAHHARLPFVMVTIFRPIRAMRIIIPSMSKLAELVSITNMDISPIGAGGVNSYMPLQVEGTFSHMLVEMARQNGPEAQGSQSRHNIRGTIFGFVVPEWMQSVSGPRIHCHFLGEENTGEENARWGGRVVEFETDGDAVISLAKCGRFHLGFPQGPEWEQLGLL